jgi:hypothetical protein
MKKFLIVIFFLIFGLTSVAHCQKHSDNLVDSMETQMHLEDLIARFNDDTDTTMKCENALAVFKKEYERNPKDPYIVLYIGRAYDNIASIGNNCKISDEDILRLSDSTYRYYRLADKMLPGIKEKKHEFPVPIMIGHLFGIRCLWYIKHGDYEKGRKELVRGLKENGFTPAQLELCRLMLDFCDTGSILFTGGDDDTFPIMYLQIVEGYRNDVSVINTSLVNMKWYLELFLGKSKKGFTHVEADISQKELDSLEVVVTKESLPDRLYTDVDIHTRTRIHKELGIDVADKAEMCFPVYTKYSGGYYTYAVQKAIASILLANKWRRRVFFSWRTLPDQAGLNCTHVAIRDGIFVEELYPINLGQGDHFKKGDAWYHDEKLKNIFLNDVQMKKFSEKQIPSSSQSSMYYLLAKYLSVLDSNDRSKKEVIGKIQSIPHEYLKGEGLEEDIFGCAREMFAAGYKEEAKKECTDLLPYFQKRLSGSKKSLGADEANYIIALIISGNCSKATDFVNSFEISQEIKDATLSQMREFYGCK